MKKTFLEIFHKYHPDTYTEKLLLTITDIKLMADKDLKIIEATLHFPQLVDKAELYRIQEEIRKAYDYDYVVINESIESAVADIEAILCAEKCKIERNKKTVTYSKLHHISLSL